MIDTRTVLDNVRKQIPGDAKLLVAYIDGNGILRLSQANMTQVDIINVSNTIFASTKSERLGLK